MFDKSITFISSAFASLSIDTIFSVNEVIKCSEQITGQRIRVVISNRRPGDPVRLVANSSLALKELGWQPKHSALNQIIRDAWAWEKISATVTHKYIKNGKNTNRKP